MLNVKDNAQCASEHKSQNSRVIRLFIILKLSESEQEQVNETLSYTNKQINKKNAN